MMLFWTRLVLISTLISTLTFPQLMGAEEEQDGNWLLRSCKNALKDEPDGSPEGRSCAGYINGIVDMNSIYQELLKGHGAFCLPAQGLETGELIQVVVKYLEANPEELNQTKRILAVKALAKAFPCEGSKRSRRHPISLEPPRPAGSSG